MTTLGHTERPKITDKYLTPVLGGLEQKTNDTYNLGMWVEGIFFVKSY